MTTTHIINLLPPLQSAIALQSWEDVEDIAGEIKRLARLKRLQELQDIQEATRDREQPKTPPGASQVAKTPSFTSYGGQATPVTLETRFDEFGHPEPWRNEVACELNWLVGLVASRQAPYVIDFVAHAALSIAARVARFEEIQVKPQTKD